MPTDRFPESLTDGELHVRRWRHDDVDAMRELISANLDHLRPWMAWARDEPIDDDRRRAMFERWDRYHEGGAGAVYGAFAGGGLIGGCAVHRRAGPGGVELGYWLGAESAGHGYATRIARLLTEAALEIDGIEFVQITHEERNESSAAVASRLGFDRVPGDPGVTRWRLRRSDAQ